MNQPFHAKRGFTLIELLTVIAILAILGAIIFPTVGQFRSMAKRSSDSTDLRNIVTASHMLATQNGEKYVDKGQTIATDGEIINSGGTSGIDDVAAVLAVGGELNNPELWISANEPEATPGGAIVISSADPDTGTTYSINSEFSSATISYGYVTGLATWMDSNTPVAFSRMQNPSSPTWGPTDVYQTTGGHVAFIGGSVSWYEDLTGKLVGPNGNAVSTINAAITGLGTEPEIAQSTVGGTGTP